MFIIIQLVEVFSLRHKSTCDLSVSLYQSHIAMFKKVDIIIELAAGGNLFLKGTADLRDLLHQAYSAVSYTKIQ